MVNFKDNPIEISNLIQEGSQVPDFELCASDLSRVSLSAFEGQLKVFNIFPSLDTGVCEKSVLEFQRRMEEFDKVTLLHISKDLPFAQTRFCLAKELKSAHTLSAFDSTFGEDYGLQMKTGPLKGLLARCVLVVDASQKVIYKDLVHEITQEPNYGALVEFLENYFKQRS